MAAMTTTTTRQGRLPEGNARPMPIASDTAVADWPRFQPTAAEPTGRPSAPPTGPAATAPAELLWDLNDYRSYNEGGRLVAIRDEGDRNLVIGELGEMSLFHGRAGTGKSWAMLWMALRLAHTGVRTLYLPTEGESSVAQRVENMGQVWPPGGAPILWRRFGPSSLLGDRPRNLDATIRERAATDGGLPVGAVVLDVASALMTSDDGENSAGVWNRIRSHLEPLTHDRVFLAVHHQGKMAAKGPRGTSRFLDDAAYDFIVREGGFPGLSEILPGSKSRGVERQTWNLRFRVEDGVPAQVVTTRAGDDPFAGLPGARR